MKDQIATDLVIHRTIVKEGTPIFRSRPRKLASNKEWWLNKFAQAGLESGIYEHTIHANGKLSRWGAEAQLVEKKGSDRPRLTFNYHNVWEDIPAAMMTLMADNMSFLGLPSHRVYSSLDMKHAYWTAVINPEDRHYLTF